jgi:D-citramalate synthase
LEDWSNGMRNSKEYVFEYLTFLASQPIERILLPDTLGILTPSETYQFIKEVRERFPKIHFDFHGHNDYDLEEESRKKSKDYNSIYNYMQNSL